VSDPSENVLRICYTAAASESPQALGGVREYLGDAVELCRTDELSEPGEFDALICTREELGHPSGADWFWLPSEAGETPLAVRFAAGHAAMMRLRTLYVRPVMLVGAGPGDPALCTAGAIAALRRCDVCLFDALVSTHLLDELPAHAEAIDVGKRDGAYNISRDMLKHIINDRVRQGQRVVRLKGGDPGIFGRLPEEIGPLVELGLPFRVLPGVSSVNAATTGTGFLLTRRGMSRGFTITTPRLAGGHVGAVDAAERARMPLVFFMSVGKTREISAELLGEGRSPDEPAAMVFGATTSDEQIYTGTITTIADAVESYQGTLPGLLVVGPIADAGFAYPPCLGPLSGQRVLLTASEHLMGQGVDAVRDFGGTPVCLPLIALTPNPDAVEALRHLSEFDWITLTSPAAIRSLMCLLRQNDIDLRCIPKIMVVGRGSARVLAEYGLQPDLMPGTAPFDSAGLAAAAGDVLAAGARVLRCRSDRAGNELTAELAALGADVTDLVLYRNDAVLHDSLPAFDTVFFASSSAVDAFVDAWGTEPLSSKRILAIGRPTEARLTEHGLHDVLVARKARVPAAIETLAAECVIGAGSR
jgi:uroporphyrinogen III methyltransferase/synthase